MKRDDDGTDLENVMTYWDVARGKEVPGDHVVVYDRMGDWAAASIVELLVN